MTVRILPLLVGCALGYIASAGPVAAADPFGAAVTTQALAAHRGGQQDQYVNDMRSRATITQTSTTQVATGNNAVSDGAFTNATGFPMVIQNTGNNVIIQNSTILNLQLK